MAGPGTSFPTDLKSKPTHIMKIELFSSEAFVSKTGEKATCLGEYNDACFTELARHEPELAARLNEVTRDILRALVRENHGNLMLDHDGIFPLSVMREVAGTPKALMLSGNSLEIDEKVAEMIAARQGSTVFFGIEKIPVGVAEKLGRSCGRLNFECPIDLSPKAAQALVQSKGLLGLWPKRVTHALAAIFSEAAGALRLNFNHPLTVGVAKKLAHHQHLLSLQLLYKTSTISPAIARELVQHQGKTLALGHLRSLSPESAGILKEYQGCLGFGSLARLSSETAAVLSEHQGGLSFWYVKISLEAMRHLAGSPGDLELYEVPLNDPLCEILAGHRGKLSLTIKDAPSIAGATALLRHSGAMTVKFKNVDESIVAQWQKILTQRNDFTVECSTLPPVRHE